MQLRAWRKSKSLSLAQVAPLFGMSIAALSDLELGRFNTITPRIIARITAVTRDHVTLDDIWVAWGKANATEFSQSRAAGRDALKAFEKPAKTRRR